MRAFPVELDDETVEELERERALLGFESRSAYVSWIVEHRASIDEGSDLDGLLAAYRERIAQLEARLAAVGEFDDEAQTEDEDAPPSAASELDRSDDSPTETHADPCSPSGRGVTGSGVVANSDGGWRQSRSDPTVQVRGSPQTTVRQGPTARSTADEHSESDRTNPDDGAESPDDGAESAGDRRNQNEPASGRTDQDEPASDRPTEEIESNLSPERIARIQNDPIAEDAGVLGTVEVDRLDELSRRAVAKTRKRLDRDVQTGLEYSSATDLAASDVRLGEDVVDLDSLSIPGRSKDVVERRREAAGHAIAYLRDCGRARKSQVVDALYEEYPAGYDTTDSWWRCIKAALRQVDAIDGGDGARVWTFDE
ncbi:hypothetical protein ACFOZ7_18070 [Natribaculum luteum]|uniref:Ribbon-helix-helix protein CopG domain-containing protein n=1 Tax=Natribaculum luteum TaxID=1586232 RepID=A0ABD5P4E5_9EURY|nr:hypothetical protein [Natribaculum luteum]